MYRKTAIAAVALSLVLAGANALRPAAAETLYNGVELPAVCRPVRTDSTRVELKWRGNADLAKPARPVHLRSTSAAATCTRSG